jgi:hypothetical protein
VLPLRLQRVEPGPRRRGRELEVIRWHVTVGARTSVTAELIQISTIECCTTSRHCVARLLVAIKLYRAVSFQALSETCVRQQGRNRAYKAKSEESDRRSLRFIHGL